MGIDIKSPSGEILATVGINVGAKGYFSLMQHDYVELPFNLREPVIFGIGSYIDLTGVFDDALGGKLSKVYYVTSIQMPTYNASTGGYEYLLRLDAYYWLWNNFIFRYTPETAGGEASWSLTGNLDMQMGVFLRNLAALGFTYNGQPFDYDIDGTVADRAVVMTYDNTRLLDALFSMGSEENWDCDVWITDNKIHFGRNESGDAVKIEIGVEAANMTRSESKGTYATRVYAFGSTRNLPENYRPVDESLLVNGVVQKRLMLPKNTPYIDANPAQSQHGVVEQVVVFDDIYPRRTGTLSDVQEVQRKYDNASNVEDSDDSDNTTQEPETFTAYQYKDTGLVFKEEYKLPGEELRIVFQSGDLNGMDFGVIFEPDGTEKGSQIWEIEANEDYGRLLPDETLKPKNGDKYILYGFNIQLVSDQYVTEAENELLQRAERYIATSKVDDGTYTVPLYSHWVKGDQIHRTFDTGQRIRLVNPGFFPSEGRTSRVIGWEMALDYPYDTPTYMIGESTRYSHLGDIEGKVETLVYKGSKYQGKSGSGIYVIHVNDSTPASDNNVYSALRSLATFLRKDRADSTKFLLSMLGGAIFGKDGFSAGLAGFGAKIDEGGNGEMESLTLRRFLETPEFRYNRVSITVGDKWRAPGLGIIETVEIDTSESEDGTVTSLNTGAITLHLENGEIGAVDVGDICMGIFHDWEVPGNNAADDFDDGKGNREYAGFCTVYFTITEILDSSANSKFRYKLRETSQSWTKQYHPSAQMHFVAYGNFNDPARQSSVYETRTYTRMLVKQNSWEIGKHNVALQWGDLSNLSVFGLDMTGYSAYLNNIYMSGTIQQTGPDPNPYRMETSVSDNDNYFHGSQPKTVTCIVFQGWENRTNEVSDWGITRNSGNTEADALWKAGDKAAAFNGTIQLDFSDLGDNDNSGTEFVMSAVMTDGKSVQTALTFRIMPVETPFFWLVAPGGNLLKKTDFTEIETDGDKYAPVTVDVYSQSGTTVIKYGDNIPLPDGIILTCRLSTASDGDYQEDMWSPGYAFHYLEHYANGKVIFRLSKDGDTINTLTVTMVVDGQQGLQGLQGEKGEQGIPGKDGKDGRTTYFHIKYSANPSGSPMSETPSTYIGTYVDFTPDDSTNPSDYKWARFQGLQGENGEQGIPGENGIDGKTYYLHIKYSNDGGVTFTANNGESPGDYIGVLTDLSPNDSLTPSDYTWSKIKGEPGNDGVTYYTWIKYADDGNGNGISDDPVGKAYIGFAYNKPTPTESNNPKDYKWSLIKGEGGVPGEPGADGTTYYTWIAYSDNADGNPMYQQPTENTKYIGIAVNKTTPIESDDPEDYTWSKFRGDDGVPGVNAMRHWIVASPSSLKKKNSSVTDTVSVTRYEQVGDGRAVAMAWGGVRYRFSRGSAAISWLWLSQGDAQGTIQVEQPTIYDSLQIQLTDEHGGGNVVQEVDVPILADGADGSTGCILRTSEWNTGVQYRNDEKLSTDGTRFLDIAVITQSATAFKAYKCKLTHIANSTNKPGSGSQWTTYWEEFNIMVPIYTPLIMAQNALLRFTQTNQLIVMKSDGTTVAAGMGGGDFPIWVGASEAEDAPFRVGIDGKLYSFNAEIYGIIRSVGGRYIGMVGNPYHTYDLQNSVKYPSLDDIAAWGDLRVINGSPNGNSGIMLPVNIGNETEWDGIEFSIKNDGDDIIISVPGNLVNRIRLGSVAITSLHLVSKTTVRFKIYKDGSISSGGVCYQVMNPSDFFISPAGDLESGITSWITAFSKGSNYYPNSQRLEVSIESSQNIATARFYPSQTIDDYWGDFYLSKMVWYNNFANVYNTNIPCHNYWFGLENGKARNLEGFDVNYVYIKVTKSIPSYPAPILYPQMHRGQVLRLSGLLLVGSSAYDEIIAYVATEGGKIPISSGKFYEFAHEKEGTYCLNSD